MTSSLQPAESQAVSVQSESAVELVLNALAAFAMEFVDLGKSVPHRALTGCETVRRQALIVAAAFVRHAGVAVDA